MVEKKGKGKTTAIGERLPIITVEKEDPLDCEGCVYSCMTAMGQGCMNTFFECMYYKRDDGKNVKFVMDYTYETIET